jgi:hypothetical protein
MTGIAIPVLPPTDETSIWVPKIGKRTRSFLDSLPPSDFPRQTKATLIDETYRILSSCHNPNDQESNRTTGLVVGRVQSGKTTSFKTLSMMAMDNNFDLIILLAGRTNNLINQNKNEFIKLKESISEKFNIGYVTKPKEWESVISINVPRIKGYGSLRAMPLILITNKHAGHINKISQELRKSSLEHINALIIDDEADNASLNTAKDKDSDFSATAIYRSIKSLRNTLERHTVTQYTATPQAVLLISKKDHYSPEWARVISPGDQYIGAKDLFFNNSPFYRIVPSDEISSAKHIKKLVLPQSFISALCSYLLASAQRLHTPEIFHDENSTFMVHPDIYNVTHNHWFKIISNKINLWLQDIESNIDLFFKGNSKNFFKEYQNLKQACNKTNTKIADFDLLFKDYVPQIIRELQIIKVNKDSNNINWNIPHNILIGGYMLDRGYVVQGLVTTYMPRGKGGGMIDSLQQRGRFYGYKKKYLGFLKTWMSKQTIDAYKSYAKHEAHLYGTLEKLSKEGKNLREWERILLLDKGLIPCRKNVMGIGLKNDYTHGGGWYYPSHPIAGSKNNKQLFEAIINHYKDKDEFKPFTIKGIDTTLWSDARSTLQVKNKSLKPILEVLRRYDPGEYDEGKFATSKMVLGLLHDRGFKASIMLTGTRVPDLNSYTKRIRPSLIRPMTTSSYFQGPDKNGTYPGERNLIDLGKKVVSIHLAKLFIGNEQRPSYVLAIKFPNENYLIETNEI